MCRIEGRESLMREPSAQHVNHPRAERTSFHHAAVEEHVRRTREAARATSDRGARRTARLSREKSREVACDRRIGGVRQSELLQSHLPAPRRHLLGTDDWEKAIDEHLIQIVAPQLGANRAADQPSTLAEHRNGAGALVRPREQRLLRDAALMPQSLQLPPVDAMAVRLEPLLCHAREGEVHVIPAEQDVIANRDALEREIAVALADQNQAEIGRAAADVHHEQQIANTEAVTPAIASAVDPRIERRLRLLEQRHAREPRLRRRAKCQLAGFLVE